MLKKLAKITGILLPTLVYSVTHGQTAASAGSFRGLVGLLIGYVQTLISIVFLATIAIFFFGMAQFLFSAGDTQKQANGKNLMFWGTIAIFVMTSMYSLITLLNNSIF